ncbi:hypothetical protein BROUX41_005561 [Berkeleyomyces rouxiae]
MSSLQRSANDARIAKFLSGNFKPSYTRKNAICFIAEAFGNSPGSYATVDTLTGSVIGITHFDDISTSRKEPGY